jgi:hypothetical protein
VEGQRDVVENWTVMERFLTPFLMRQYADAWFLVTIGYSIQGIFTFTDGIPI